MPKSAYAFPTKSRCPSCGSLATQSYSRNDGVQYRKCSPCGKTFKVLGSRA